MKNPKLITKPFAQNGQKNAIPENYSSSMESNQATWDQGFGQITMIPVAAGGLPPKGQDFNGIFNQISENVVYLSKGGRFKFSADYAAAINGYPKGAILQSDDEKKEYQSLVDNNKVNFNTATQVQINAAWKLFSTDDMLLQIAGKQPAGDYATKTDLSNGLAGRQPAGDYATNAALNNGLASKLDKTGGELTGPITAKYTVTAVGDDVGALAAQFNFIDGKPTVRAKLGNNWFNSYLPQKNGTIAHIGDSGIGIKIPPRFTNAEIPNLMTGQHFLQWGGEEDSAFAAFGGGTIINYYDTIGFGLFFRGFNGGACNFTVNKGVITRYDIYNTANTDTDRNGNLKLKGSSELSDCQVGVPLPWPQATAPAGYLICNGQSFNKTSYPLLAKAYPSGVLPDLRGEFIRGLDAGRNVDSGRAALSAQSDAIRDITGEIQGINLSGNGVFGGRSVVAYGMSPNGSGKDQFKLNYKASNVVPTANENRPRNIAFLYIVRAA
ncbi:phage tail protein [Providencia manganoxydans]|uniref:phage tail protein n=1 Tax=Providencia manganoxydans TaxID=2923283 RepID=UPI0034E5DF3E